MKDFEQIKSLAVEKLKSCEDLNFILKLKNEVLGKKSELVQALKSLSNLEINERKRVGKLVNMVKIELEKEFEEAVLKCRNKQHADEIKKEKVDVTLPGTKFKLGFNHPLTVVMNSIVEIFVSMGFSVVEGDEIETDEYNFDALNIPKNHPARDLQDTFYVENGFVLRTQTSPVQVHVMENNKPPIKIISAGRVYRSDSVDATHSPIFHQIEGLAVGKNISMANLKGTLEAFVFKLFGKDVKIRFRPHHFPFTEPSAEMDISCIFCGGKGCSTCKQEGFIEILGCGMVHPEVLKRCSINPDEFSGFAFGMGLERIVMFCYGINNLRLFYENNMRFLSQF